MLLHWLANNMNIDNNDNMRLKFNPTRGDFGFHFYLNADRPPRLPFLSSESGNYYSFGNLNTIRHNTRALPGYVSQLYRNSRTCAEIDERNRDRILVQVSPERLDQSIAVDNVFITQHHPYNQNLGTAYDPENTYRITPNLLRQIQSLSTIAQSEIPRRFNVEFNNNILNDLERIWRGPVCSNVYYGHGSWGPGQIYAAEKVQ
ncbi:uncharacterized protein LOC121534483 [Coregonus clupeaformis]|uniref:uncharacterized protein LOC121534483 n=1 Tax=Coregonus clupeaformis TaxID=59861 RepID=UPI001BE0F70F|nr:uncharacterized protein LOC121534483 [Coregonus clupeaformis]